jgi:hypothetical protein
MNRGSPTISKSAFLAGLECQYQQQFESALFRVALTPHLFGRGEGESSAANGAVASGMWYNGCLGRGSTRRT